VFVVHVNPIYRAGKVLDARQGCLYRRPCYTYWQGKVVNANCILLCVTKKYFPFAANIWPKVTHFKLKLLASLYIIYNVVTKLFVDPLMCVRIVQGSATLAKVRGWQKHNNAI
jgi:hypothetical protein